MVVKEATPWPPMRRSPDGWRNKLPREVHMHELIAGSRTATSHLNVIRHRGHRLMMAKERYRLYLDLCDGGSLADAMEDHWGNEPQTYDPGNGQFHPLPEVYIWHLFQGLVHACLVLEQGRVDQCIDAWKSLVHNDIHVSNIQLGIDSLNPTVCIILNYPVRPTGH
jgi:hypothetical protein